MNRLRFSKWPVYKSARFKRFFFLLFAISLNFVVNESIFAQGEELAKFGIIFPKGYYDIPTSVSSQYNSKVIYIDPSAEENGSGTLASPYNSWSYVSFSENCSYLQKKGTTDPSQITLNVNNVLIGAYGSGNRPIIKGGVRIEASNTVVRDIHTKTKIVIGKYKYPEDNNTVYNCEVEGDAISGWGGNIKIIGCIVHECGDDGMFIRDQSGKDNKLEIAYCYIYNVNLNWFNDQTEKGSPGDNIQIQSFTEAHIHHNVLDHSNTGNKFCFIVGDASDFWGTKRLKALFEHNILYTPAPGPNGGSGFYSADETDLIIRYNKIISLKESTGYGIYLGNYDSNYEIYGNLINNTLRDIHAGDVTNVYNNTIVNVKESGAKNWHYAKNNIISSTVSSLDGSNIFLDKVNEKDIFVSPENNDYRLKEGCQAINAGTTTKMEYDMNGVPIPQNGLPDIGAFEYTTDTFPFNPYPNPDTNPIPIDTGNVKPIPDSNLIVIRSISAGSSDGVNLVEYLADGDLNTRWSSDAKPAIANLSFEKTYTISGFRIALYRGDERKTSYQIFVSTDSITWKSIYLGESSGLTEGYETVNIDSVDAKYIRLEGYGNNLSETLKWTSISELEFWGAEIKNEKNYPPIIKINSKYSSKIKSGQTGIADGTNSYDPDGEKITFKWLIPNEFDMSDNTPGELEFLAPIVTQSKNYQFILEVTDGLNIERDTFDVEVEPFNANASLAKVYSISASSYQENYYPENIIDNNLETRWSSQGDNEWVILELDNIYQISHVQVSFWNRESSEAYFDIYGSLDNINWEVIDDNYSSCGFSSEQHSFGIPEVKSSDHYKYIKIVGHGNSENDWNSFSDIKIFGDIAATSSTEVPIEEILDVYPNPANSVLNIVPFGLSGDELTLSILDISGKIISQSSLTFNKESYIPIDVSNLSRGVYFIQLNSSSQRLSKKIIIE